MNGDTGSVNHSKKRLPSEVAIVQPHHSLPHRKRSLLWKTNKPHGGFTSFLWGRGERPHLRSVALISNIKHIELYEGTTLQQRFARFKHNKTLQRCNDTVIVTIILLILLVSFAFYIVHKMAGSVEPKEYPTQHNPFKK